MTLTLEQLDRNEALLEAVAALHGHTQARFVRTASLGSGALFAALAAPSAATTADFYTEADALGTVGKMPAAKQRWGLGARRTRARPRTDLEQDPGQHGRQAAVLRFPGATETDDGFTPTAVAGSTSASRRCPMVAPAGCRGRRWVAIAPSTRTSSSISSASPQPYGSRCRTVFRARVGVGRSRWPIPRDASTFAIGSRATRAQRMGPCLRRQRAVGTIHRRAGRPLHRHPRHRPAAVDSRPQLSRMNPNAQRRHPQAREADSDRHGFDDHVSQGRERRL
jgi:hypothetical protein